MSNLEGATAPVVLWSAYYWQNSSQVVEGGLEGDMLLFPDPPLDLLFDDTVLDRVRDVWTGVTKSENVDSFLTFEDRESGFKEDDEY